MYNLLKQFFKHDAIGGILLIIATIFAIFTANFFTSFYEAFVNIPINVGIIDKPLLLWVNDGLMAIFFFLIGLEVKRELLAGELKNPKNVVLPMVGAVGGMLLPALIYVGFNSDNPEALKGWAIPAATDIAFALGILMLLGKKVPVSLKVFLVTLAIADDMGAVVIIALFYTAKINLIALFIVGAMIIVLYLMNRYKVLRLLPYILVTLIMWVAMLKSGVHATLAGVIAAFFIPFLHSPTSKHTLLQDLEHSLHPTVTFVILPIFAFVNTGLSFEVFTLSNLSNDVSLGIILGLFIGKQVGVFGLCVLTIKLGFAQLPTGSNYIQLYAVSILCGIGFTMSLFIGSLAFNEDSILVDERFAILVGSTLSAVVGYFLLGYCCQKYKASA